MADLDTVSDRRPFDHLAYLAYGRPYITLHHFICSIDQRFEYLSKADGDTADVIHLCWSFRWGRAARGFQCIFGPGDLAPAFGQGDSDRKLPRGRVPSCWTFVCAPSGTTQFGRNTRGGYKESCESAASP